MSKLNKKFIKKYLNTPSPVGFEAELGGQGVWAEEAKKYCDKIESDEYGNVWAISGNLNSKYIVTLDAHGDEIAWYVKSIEKNGCIRVQRNGGSDHQIAPSMRVNIWGRDGKAIPGVFGHPAIHIHDRPKEIKMDSLFVDIGATDDAEVKEMGVEIGRPITFQDGYMELGKKSFVSRAIDDKIGGYTTIEVMRRIKENEIELPFKLIVINSVQEEIGLRGAGLAANQIKPNVSLIVDVCHEDSSPAYKTNGYKAGDGTVLTIAPSVQNNLLNFSREILDKNGIKYLLYASSTSSGTNTDSYAYIGGAPSMLFSIPIAYMHTTGEKVHEDDIITTIDAMYNTIINIEEGQSFKYKI